MRSCVCLFVLLAVLITEVTHARVVVSKKHILAARQESSEVSGEAEEEVQEDEGYDEKLQDIPDVLDKAALREEESKLLQYVYSKSYSGVFPGIPTNVSIGVGYMCANYDEKTHVLTSRVVERLEWTDERLTWDPKDFGGIDELRLPGYYLWHPDIKLYNSAESSYKDWVNAHIYPTGKVVWTPPITYKSFCSPTGKNTASCKHTLGSWTYDGTMVPLETSESVYMDSYDPACPYSMENTKSSINVKHYDCCEEPYPSLDIEFTIRENN